MYNQKCQLFLADPKQKCPFLSHNISSSVRKLSSAHSHIRGLILHLIWGILLYEIFLFLNMVHYFWKASFTIPILLRVSVTFSIICYNASRIVNFYTGLIWTSTICISILANRFRFLTEEWFIHSSCFSLLPCLRVTAVFLPVCTNNTGSIAHPMLLRLKIINLDRGSCFLKFDSLSRLNKSGEKNASSFPFCLCLLSQFPSKASLPNSSNTSLRRTLSNAFV